MKASLSTEEHRPDAPFATSETGSFSPSVHASSSHKTMPEGRWSEVEGLPWYRIDHCHRMPPFLTNVLGSGDVWMFAASNGAITAGRRNPDHAIFPYYTQDRLFDSAGTTGSATILLVEAAEGAGESQLWEPWNGAIRPGSVLERAVAKNKTGSRLIFEETHPLLGLTWTHLWSSSDRHGVVRKASIRNNGASPVRIRLVDGLLNLLPAGVEQDFQTQFSNLADAYKKSELLRDSGLGVFYLSSVPTDRAEPSEGLRASVAWTTASDIRTRLLSTGQLDAFRAGESLRDEFDIRGRRCSYLYEMEIALAPGESASWWTAADTGLDAAAVEALDTWLAETENPAAELQAEIDATDRGLAAIAAAADGVQSTADTARTWRHFSNTLFNLMRGGTFVHGGLIPRDAFLKRLQRANRSLAEKHAGALAALPDFVPPRQLFETAQATGDPDLIRHAGEFLPLSFSRRHGDPSRPWNRFSIDIRDAAGNPQLAYQGNWRDIFQNWEALVHAFPEYTEATIFRFLNASTADGYNPYRVTQDGFDWETIEPDEPWSNIGYWGDHQIIYLLKLLEHAEHVHAGKLAGLLSSRVFVYANVPYRIRSYSDILDDPRSTIDYDDHAAEAIERAVSRIGTDGQLLRGNGDSPARATLLEKLLVPLLAKLSNLVLDGGIWMNTQRPEWNDANNALVGYGVSVVTLGYVHRYLRFLIRLLENADQEQTDQLASEIACWLEAQADTFEEIAGPADTPVSPALRKRVLDSLGESASKYRDNLYTSGLSGETVEVSRDRLLRFLENARAITARSLLANRRSDGLWHSYNLLKFEAEGGAGLARLDEMLEGQVSILSAEILPPTEAVALLDALRASRLWREDQRSYTLYPDRNLPTFLEKNRIPEDALQTSELLRAMLEAGDTSVIVRDVRGHLRFNGDFRNASDLRARLAKIADPRWAKLATQESDTIAEIFEEVFNHHAFTGRSGTFFAYEGLGSIYWHMVSKLLLAIQENHAAARLDHAEPEIIDRLARHYHETLDGLGIHKSPALYGAFPTDAYSHTPANAGAQQPGMTGQVKEDFLTRMSELGVSFANGTIRFEPRLLKRSEFLSGPGELRIHNGVNEPCVFPVPANALAFTVCGLPVIYSLDDGPTLELHHENGEITTRGDATLTTEESSRIFERRHDFDHLVVRPSADALQS